MSEINHNNVESDPQKNFKFMFFVEKMLIVKITMKNLPSFFVSGRTVTNFKIEAMILSSFHVVTVLLLHTIDPAISEYISF